MPIGIELLLIEIFKNESQILEPSSKDNVISMEYLSMNLEHHPVFKLPRCKCCGVHNKRPKNKIWEEI
jgi:hypothetical protein